MGELIIILLALGINFCTPVAPKSNKNNSASTEFTYPKGFPYSYFENEILTPQQVNYRLRIIYMWSIFGISNSFPLGSASAIMLPVPSSTALVLV